MNDVTRMLRQASQGDRAAAEQLLPLLYEELRQLAAAKLRQERPGQTLEATALVHEAYMRLVADGHDGQRWDGRGHFFAAAAEAMRRILVDSARRKQRLKHGGDRSRVELDEIALESSQPREEILALDAALTKLQAIDGTAAELIQLRYFTGLTLADAADILDISPRTADRTWAYAKAWLHREIQASGSGE